MDIIVVILVGAVAGWVASLILRLDTSPLIKILLGVVGGILADEIFSAIGISLASGLLGDVIESIIGALLLVLTFRLFNRKK